VESTAPGEPEARNVNVLFWALRELAKETSRTDRDREARVLFDELSASAPGVLRRELGDWYSARSPAERDELVSDAIHRVVIAATIGPSRCRAESAGAAWLWCKRILVRSARKAIGREQRIRELARSFGEEANVSRSQGDEPLLERFGGAVELVQRVCAELRRTHRADHAQSLADALLEYVENLLGARLNRHSTLRARRPRGQKRSRNTAYQRRHRGREAGRAAVHRIAERGELSAPILECAVMLSLVDSETFALPASRPPR
jgi:hypothetical protein